MPKKLVYQKPECATGHHEHHLCFLMGDGFHFSNKAEYKAMVQNAEYRCENCSRTACAARHLCAPIPL